MTVARSVADVLTRHVTLEVESIDRMYCNVYQPKLQYPAGLVGFLRGRRGETFASTTLVAPMSQRFSGGHCCVGRAGDGRNRLTCQVDQIARASSVNATATRSRVVASVPNL
jgi:hypothetical protein